MKTAMEQVMSFLKDDYDRANVQVRNYIAGILKLEKKCMEIERKQLENAWNDGEKEGYAAGYQQCEDGSTNRSSLFDTYFKTTYNEKD